MINTLRREQVVLEAQEYKMNNIRSVLEKLPWRIIKTTLSVIVAIAILPSVSYVLFGVLFPIYPFVFMSHKEVTYIGSTSTALYFTAMAATKGVGNTLSSTWKAISSQIISNFFGAVMGVVISSTLAEILGPTHPLTIGSGIFILYLILKRLQLNDAFTLGGITFITIVVLSTADYPPLVRGVDRFYSMAVGLIVSGVINIIFLSPKKSAKHLFEQLLSLSDYFNLKTSLNEDEYSDIQRVINSIKKDTEILIKDEKIEKKIFFWRKEDEFERQILADYVTQSQLLLSMDKLLQGGNTCLRDIEMMQRELKINHYEMMKTRSNIYHTELISNMREWLFEHYKQIDKFNIVQFLDDLNQYEQLLIKE